jgi:hypothetical protein
MDQRKRLKELQVAAQCIPKGLAQEILAVSIQRRKALTKEGKEQLHGLTGLLLTIVLIVYLVPVMRS